MGLFVTTTGVDITIPELGIIILDPTVDRDLSGQFTSDELSFAANLTSYIQAGTLVWKKTSGGSVEPPADYDPNFLEIDEENLGPGQKRDRAVTFKDLSALYKSGVVAAGSFSGSPKTATVTFGTAFPSVDYAIVVTGSDGRSWTVSSLTVGGFVISTQASQALTGPVYWEATLIGE